MTAYLLRRLISTVPVLFISSVLVFMIIHLIPGDPALHLLPPNPSEIQIQLVRERYGFDRPLPEQYLQWLSLVAQGDLGTSISNGFKVTELLRARFVVTAQLGFAGFALALLIAIPMGIGAGLRPRGFFARLVSVYTAVGFVIPSFWLGILLILFFSVHLGVLPTSGFRNFFDDPLEALRRLILPAFTLSVATSVIIANYLKFSIQEVTQMEFVTAAIAKGLPYRRVLLKHILRNALIPVVTVAALQLGLMLAGTVITENVFSIPGMGALLVNAISARDFAVVQGTLLVIVVIFIVLNLITDLLYARLDPRIRFN